MHAVSEWRHDGRADGALTDADVSERLITWAATEGIDRGTTPVILDPSAASRTQQERTSITRSKRLAEKHGWLPPMADYTKQYSEVAAEMIDGGETAAIKFEARAVKGVTCGVDYWLGDIIRARLTQSTGVDVTAVVREIDIEQGEHAPIYRPVIGEGGATNTPRTILDVNRLFGRVRYLEGR